MPARALRQPAEPCRSIAQGAGHVDCIARFGATAVKRGTRCEIAAHLYADYELLAFRRVTADQHDAPFVRRLVEPGGKLIQPIRIRVDKGQRQCHPARCSPHRGDVREIDGHDAIADIARIHVRREMGA